MGLPGCLSAADAPELGFHGFRKVAPESAAVGMRWQSQGGGAGRPCAPGGGPESQALLAGTIGQEQPGGSSYMREVLEESGAFLLWPRPLQGGQGN